VDLDGRKSDGRPRRDRQAAKGSPSSPILITPAHQGQRWPPGSPDEKGSGSVIMAKGGSARGYLGRGAGIQHVVRARPSDLEEAGRAPPRWPPRLVLPPAGGRLTIFTIAKPVEGWNWPSTHGPYVARFQALPYDQVGLPCSLGGPRPWTVASFRISPCLSFDGTKANEPCDRAAHGTPGDDDAVLAETVRQQAGHWMKTGPGPKA